MQVEDLSLDGVRLVRPARFRDARGYFAETFQATRMADALGRWTWVQDNVSLSIATGTVRGLHFQAGAHAQAKLVAVLAGAVLDVVVDIRPDSATFGRHLACRLDAEEGGQLFVPPGYAHGFCTLEPNSLVAYKVSAYYCPDAERGIAWDDPDLGIAWPVAPADAILSPRDRALPTLAQCLAHDRAALGAAPRRVLYG